VWGRLQVRAGTVTFVFEADGPDGGPGPSLRVGAGHHLDIPPQVAHRVEPEPGARFAVEFHVPSDR